MKGRLRSKACCWIFGFAVAAFAGSPFALAQPKSPHASMVSAKQFVQSFYDWYAPLAIKGDAHGRQADEPTDIVAIRKKPFLFDAVLTANLKSDWNAQSKCPGYIVGIDYDPFLEAQDIDGKYIVAGAERTKKGFRVAVNLSGFSKRRQHSPALFADVIFQSGHWVFVDFLDRDRVSVMGTLAQLRKDGQACPSS